MKWMFRWGAVERRQLREASRDVAPPDGRLESHPAAGWWFHEERLRRVIEELKKGQLAPEFPLRVVL